MVNNKTLLSATQNEAKLWDLNSGICLKVINGPWFHIYQFIQWKGDILISSERNICLMNENGKIIVKWANSGSMVVWRGHLCIGNRNRIIVWANYNDSIMELNECSFY